MSHPYATPYADLLLPLSSAEMEALRQRIIDEGGIHDPVLLTEDDVVLDGHNRLKIDSEAPVKRIPGSGEWSDAQRRAFIIRCNRGRRNLSSDQEKALEKTSKEIALDLNREHKTQPEIAAIFGVSQQRVSQWLGMPNTTPSSNGNENGQIVKIDCRVTVPKEARAVIFERSDAGETQEQIAADFGINQSTVSKIITKEKERIAQEEERARRAAEIAASAGDRIVQLGDFRDVALNLADGSVSFIFTDPPYDRKSVSLYGDLAEVATRVLRPGGSLICYCGQYLLPEIIPLMAEYLDFYWCCACVHTGPMAKMREYGITVAWKPMLWFTNGSRPTYEKQDFVTDLVESGGREKTHHDWQQSEVEALYYIEKLSRPGELLFEPFAGGGTTVAAAIKLGRQVVAAEIDTEKCHLAEQRARDAECSTHAGTP